MLLTMILNANIKVLHVQKNSSTNIIFVVNGPMDAFVASFLNFNKPRPSPLKKQITFIDFHQL
jgi:hypothetical protein